MPGIRALREKKLSFKQIGDLLEKVGFALKVSTVRTYYGELLAKEKQDGFVTKNKTA